MRVGWLDCSSGVSGDMLVGALADAGVDVLAAADAVSAVLPAGRFTVETVTRGGLRATRFVSDVDERQPLRTLADIVAVLDAIALPKAVIARARSVFGRLADAESRVHGVTRDEVHFHEVGAVDTVVDVVCACAGFHALSLDRLVVSPIALGGGTAATQHGAVPVPGPAVLELLRDGALAAHGGPIDAELATPTGVALVVELADASAPMPAMTVEEVAIGAGTRELQDRPNVVRLVMGTEPGAPDTEPTWQLIEANVDDLDPRLWPSVLDRLLAAGAADAWLTPILMKKGRPAHTVSVLTTDRLAGLLRDALFRESSTIGVRTTRVGKQALDRTWVEVEVDGETVRVKVARLDGEVVNVSPEWEDVAAAARALDRPVKSILAAAVAAAQALDH